MNAIELGMDVGTMSEPSEFPCIIRDKHLLKFAPTGYYLSFTKMSPNVGKPYFEVTINKNAPPVSTKIRTFGGNVDEKVRIMARCANFNLSELDNDEINMMVGGIHVAPAVRVGQARRPRRYDYRSEGKLPPKARGIRWLMDTGCGFDLAKRSHLVRCGLRKQITKSSLDITINTPAGPQPVTHEAAVNIPSLNEEVPIIVLKSTPDVLSIGRRCVQDGYKFVWNAHSEQPYLVSPSGKKITLSVHGFIPSLEPAGEDFFEDEEAEHDSAPTVSSLKVPNGPRLIDTTSLLADGSERVFTNELDSFLVEHVEIPLSNVSRIMAHDSGTKERLLNARVYDSEVTILRPSNKRRSSGQITRKAAREHARNVAAAEQADEESEMENEETAVKKGRYLKAEATSIQHMLTHFPQKPALQNLPCC